MEQKHLINRAIPNASTNLAYWETKVHCLRNELQATQMEVEASAGKYGHLQTAEDKLAVDVESIKQKEKVTTMMKGAMEQLNHFHTTKSLRQ